MKLNQTEAEVLLAIINGTTNNIKRNKRVDNAIRTLTEKGFLRCNKHQIVEIALCDDYLETRGYQIHLKI